MRKYLLFVCGILLAGNVHAGIIGVFGESFSIWDSSLTAAGHTAVNVDSETSAAQLATLDQVWLIRQNENSNLIDYVGNGGAFTTEWSVADWVLDTVSMLDSNADLLDYIATNTQITFDQDGIDLGLSDNVGNPYANGGSTEYFHSVNHLGTDVVATITEYNLGVTGGYGVGNVLALVWSWRDVYSTGNITTQDLVTDITNVGFGGLSVSEPVNITFPGLVGFSLSR